MQSKILKKETDKEALIRRLSAEQCSLMVFYEETPPAHIAHQKLNEFIFLLHPPYDYQILEQWLYIGNWQAIFPPNENYKFFNTFRTKNVEIKQRMLVDNISLIIDSFHDNIEWNVIELLPE
jgi:hypothetical protein